MMKFFNYCYHGPKNTIWASKNVLVLVLLMIFVAGCQKQSVPGGTEGVVHAGATRLMDIQVELHDASLIPMGFGVSGIDGAFRLFHPRAKGPLWLKPGDYRITLQSIGPIPQFFPKTYTNPETTPLRLHWTENDRILDLEIPQPHDRPQTTSSLSR